MSALNAELEAVFDVVASASREPASRSEETLRWLLGRLGEIVGATPWALVGHRPLAPDGSFGPAAPQRPVYASDRVARERMQIVADYVDHANYAADPSTARLIGGWGAHRVQIRSQFPKQLIAGTASQGLMEALSLEDRLMAVHVVDAQREVYIGLDRHNGCFDARDLLLAKAVICGIGNLARAWSLSQVGPRGALSPRERDVLQQLLGGESEKRGATNLGLTRGSFHQHVVSIYRKLQVSTRAELMAMFMGEDPVRE